MFLWTKLKLDNLSKKNFYFFLFFGKWKILNDYNNAIVDLKDKIKIIENTLYYCKKNNWGNIYKIWNVAGFLLATSLDIKIINEQLIKSKGFWRNEYIIKSACILIFEVLEDLEQILGKDFYLYLKELSISDDLINILNQNKKNLSILKSLYHKDLKKVRTIIWAHRDHDFLTQLEIFNELENTSIMKLINEFEQKINSLADSLQNIMNQSTENFIKKNTKFVKEINIK